MMNCMKKNQPIYEEMRSLSPYFLITAGIYLSLLIVIFFAVGFDYSLIIGGLYGCVIAVLNFLILGKTAQSSLRRNPKSAQTFMSTMYCVRYLGLFILLTLGALAPFINLIAAAVPLFFPRIAITVREIIASKKKEE